MTRRILLFGMAGFACLCLAAQGATIVVDTWDAEELGWGIHAISGESAATLANPGTPGGTAALGFDVDTDGEEGVSEDIIYTDNDDFTGNYATGAGLGGTAQPVKTIRFDFYSDPDEPGYTAPAYLSVYFLYHSGEANETEWFYDIDVNNIVEGWNYELVNLLPDGWYAPGGENPGGFATAITDVDEVGILIDYQPDLPGLQTYGIDNFELNDSFIPEPGTYAMLGFSMLSLGVTFRRKLSATLANLKRG